MGRMLGTMGGVMAIACVLTSTASAAPDRTAKVVAGSEYTFTGSQATGANLNYWGDLDRDGLVFPRRTCDKSPLRYCDVVLITFDNPLTAAEVAAGRTSKTRVAQMTVDDSAGLPNDYDLAAYSSDASGGRGAELDHDSRLPVDGATAEVALAITTTSATPTRYVLFEIPYVAVADGRFTGRVRF